MVFRRPRPVPVREGDSGQNQPPTHLSYLIQTQGKPTAKAKRLLHALGTGEAIGDITFVATLTGTQVDRLRQQPWISSVGKQQIMHALSTQATTVVREKEQPPTWGIYTHKQATKAQADTLWLLGADVPAGLNVRAFELELTELQIERLRTLKWVKLVAPAVQFHTCSPGQATADTTEPTAPNYAKIDATLSTELQNRRDPNSKEIGLFINTFIVPNSDQVAFLAALGVNGTDRKTTLFTGRLSQNDIAALSNQTWVKVLRGSNKLKPL